MEWIERFNGISGVSIPLIQILHEHIAASLHQGVDQVEHCSKGRPLLDFHLLLGKLYPDLILTLCIGRGLSYHASKGRSLHGGLLRQEVDALFALDMASIEGFDTQRIVDIKVEVFFLFL